MTPRDPTRPEPWRALLVDDEPLARDLLRELLDHHHDVAIVGEAADGDEALRLLRADTIDVLFLDIRMPAKDGFDVLHGLPPDRLPQVVFVTAFNHYAVRAFEVEAIDYLVKPYDQQRLDRTMERVRRRLTERHQPDPRQWLDAIERLHRPSYAERLFLRTGERTRVVAVRDICWLEARRKMVRVHVGGRAFEVRDSLKRFESDELDPRHFVRVSRSAIVHLDHVVEIQRWFHGEWILLLDDGAQIPTTRRYRDRVDALLSNRR